ncbi:MAG: hypothetical protein ACR2PJ_02405, partial [Pseudomonadales bacterium]
MPNINQLGHLNAIRGDEPWLAGGGAVAFTYTHRAGYIKRSRRRLKPPADVELGVLYAAGGSQCLITDQPDKLLGLLDQMDIQDLAQALETQLLDLSAPLPLTPVHIPKPWGEELWYTGIEERGVSLVGKTPIAWLLDMFGALLAPSHLSSPPLLLKILAPHPTPNLGDLYFELHKEKVEVYVVTGLDKDAWPDGLGAIRYGFNPELVAASESDDAFRQAYLDKVHLYETVRREVDAQLDRVRLARGIADDTVLPPDEYAAMLQQEVPDALRQAEAEARAAMYEYTNLAPLALGDVVQVQPGVPHSLQHGIRVVEFQTPHYERQILSFGQKALTQDGWDTEDALQQALLNAES